MHTGQMADARPPRSYSIRIWLLAVVAATALPLLLFDIWLAQFEYQRARAAALSELRNVSRALLQAVEREFQNREGTLLTLASSPALQNGNFEDFHSLAASVAARMPPTSGIILADESGQQIINTRQPFGTPLPRRGDLTSLKKVFETGQTWVSDLFVGALMGIPVVGVDVAVHRDGKPIYNLALSVPIQELDRILERQRLPEGWVAAIVDRNGTIVSRNVDTEKWIGRKLADPILRSIRESAAHEGHSGGPTLEGVDVISAWARSPVWGWAVAIGQPEHQINRRLVGSLVYMVLGGIASLLIALFIASLVSRRVVAAMSSLTASAAAIGSEAYRAPKPARIAEIDGLSETLTRASGLLRERAAQRDAAEQHQGLLMAELDHRVKNILASVQAIARQSLGRSPQAQSLIGRLMALARAHNLLAQSRWRGATLRELLEAALEAHRDEGRERIRVDGPDIVLDAKVTQSLSLVLHELWVNAMKYGALSQPEGEVQVTWSVEPSGRLTLDWTERKGPPVNEPAARGFGSRLIELSVQDLRGEVRTTFGGDGLHCRIAFPLQPGAAARPAHLPASRPGALRTAAGLQGKRVLLVEDAALVSRDLSDYLESAGILVQPAASVSEALRFVAVEPPDAAVLDVNLNGELVFPVAEALRERGVPFVFVTGYGDAHVWPPHFRHSRRLMKPTHGGDVIEALAAAMQDE